MSLRKKRLSMNESPALIPQEDQQSFDAELAGLINSQQIKLDETRTGNRTFFEDFTWEHSLSGSQDNSIEFAGFF
jgi:hypothetical protein